MKTKTVSENKEFVAYIDGEAVAYPSYEAFLEDEARRTTRMDEAVEPWQRRLCGERGYFMSTPYYEMPLDRTTVLVIYGQIVEDGRHPNEPVARAFSAGCEEGEIGPVHLATIGRRLTREEFEAFRLRGWPGAPATGKGGR